MIDPEGAESPPEVPAGSRRPGAVVAMVVIAAIVSGAVSAGVTLAILRSQARTDPQTVDLGSNVRITEDSAIIQVADKAAPAVATVVTGRVGQGLGSAYLTTSDGYLVTNAHVVANASGLAVIFAGSSARHDARLVDSDCQTDVAVLKVDGVANLPTLAFGDVSSLRAGQTVIAVGSPLGQRAVGSGIISSLNRVVTVADPVGPVTDRTYSDTIQSSAPVDAVSSGGPLLNVGGQVIGVNVAAESSGGLAAFAISAADIRSEVEQIVRDGKLVVPSLGVVSRDLTSQDAALQNVPVGASFSSVTAAGPAEVAGVKAGDIITAVDEVKLDDAHPLLQVLVTQFRPAQRVTLTLSRQGAATQVQATLGGKHPVCG
ncbi:MAG: S1C family serine protease [Candidatus Dormibacteraeota bacterium]|nr:S1C family serine protease [Candidatus Dormibacteraeota bacterium]